MNKEKTFKYLVHAFGDDAKHCTNLASDVCVVDVASDYQINLKKMLEA
jgi:hypothetical protein